MAMTFDSLLHPRIGRFAAIASLALVGFACASEADVAPAGSKSAAAETAGAQPTAAQPAKPEAKPAPSAAAGAAPAAAPVALAALTGPAVDAAKPAELPGLHNVVAYGPGVYSGSVPQGAEGFDALRRMGVKTVISVDGAAPDLALAKAEGLRYVHLPIGYDGVPAATGMEIARAMSDLEGPFYIHCHHGKHRSAAAAGAACVALGTISNEEAVARMKVSGTAPDYVGLYQSVERAHKASPDELRAASNAFPEVTKVEGMVALMSEIDEVFDLVKQVKDGGWVPPADHPDLVPTKETARLRSLFGRVKTDPDALSMPAEFAGFLQQTEDASIKLDDALRAGAPSAELVAHLKTVQDSCKRCHVVYRDKPH